MALDVLALYYFFTAFEIEPTSIAGDREARRVDREIHFYRSQRPRASDNQSLKDRSKFRVLEVKGDGIVVRHLRDMTALLGLSQIAHENPTGSGCIHLKDYVENHVSEIQARTPHSLSLIELDSLTYLGQEALEPILLEYLRFVVGRPVLMVWFALLLWSRALAGLFFTSPKDLRSVDVLTDNAMKTIFRACALGRLFFQTYLKDRVPLQRGDRVEIASTLDLARGCYLHSAFFFAVHSPVEPKVD
jgi:hypothetical protein